MLAVVLLGAGAAVFAGALLVARATRRDASHEDVLAALSPVDDLERGRPRAWPAVTALGGLVLMAGGVLAAQAAPAEQVVAAAREPTARPTLVSVLSAAVEPTPTPTPTPTPAPTPAPPPAPTAPALPSAAAPSAPASGGSGVSPAAPRPGPQLSSSASCADGKLWVGYSATALAGTTISGIKIAAAGVTYSPDGAPGSNRHNGTWQRSVEPGSHTVTVTARGSDGGVTRRQHTVGC